MRHYDANYAANLDRDDESESGGHRPMRRRPSLDLYVSDGTVMVRGSGLPDPPTYTESDAARMLLSHADLLAAVEELLAVRTGDGLLDPASPAFARAAAAVAKAKGV